eukprot:6420785-Heterocapsa_arctica.AAC.1
MHYRPAVHFSGGHVGRLLNPRAWGQTGSGNGHARETGLKSLKLTARPVAPSWVVADNRRPPPCGTESSSALAPGLLELHVDVPQEVQRPNSRFATTLKYGQYDWP